MRVMEITLIECIDLDENGDAHSVAGVDPPNFETSLHRIEEIKRLLIEDYKLQQYLSIDGVTSQNTQAEEYQRKRTEILSIFSKVISSNPFAMNSPFTDRVSKSLACDSYL